jgi:hypothetical protein
MRAVGFVLATVVTVFGCGQEKSSSFQTGGGSISIPTVVGSAGVPGSGGAGAASSVPVAGRSGPLSPAGATGGAPIAGVGSGGMPAAASGGTPAAASGGMSAAGSGTGPGGMGATGVPGEPPLGGNFSFFVTSLAGMRMLANNTNGFGGDLRFGEATGLAGADKICTMLAEKSLPGSGAKGWRAFLSAAKGGEGGGPVHAKDRIGQGPWYDRNGRLIAMNLANLLMPRPAGCDPAIVNDLPNENGIPNQMDTMPGEQDNHDTVTGTNVMGMYDGTPTCNDWTTTETAGAAGAAGSGTMGMAGRGGFRPPMLFGPRIGHSWPAQSGMNWMTAHQAPGCAPSVSLVQTGIGTGVGIGNGGGYGGIYCFALKP